MSLELRLANATTPLEQFLFEVRHLERKLGCLLLQLPPSFVFDKRVAEADPELFSITRARRTNGDVAYFCFHGTPRMYYSNYGDVQLSAFAERVLAAAGRANDVWCIFDNTALGAAVPNALELRDLLRAHIDAG